MKPHLNQDKLIERMYGVGGDDAIDAHLRDCAECSGRLQALREAKTRLGADEARRSVVSNAFLASQRRAIYARLDQAAASHVRWAPALVAAGLLAMGIFLLPHPQYRAAHAPVPAPVAELNDNQQLFSDLYSMEQSVEPLAAAPIHELFEETSGVEAQ